MRVAPDATSPASGEDGVENEPDVRQIAAIPRVPAERRTAKPRGLVDQQQDEPEGVRQAYESSSAAAARGDRRVAGVKRAAKAPIGRTLRSHEHMFSHVMRPAVERGAGLTIPCPAGCGATRPLTACLRSDPAHP
jgi:hypothetical protein